MRKRRKFYRGITNHVYQRTVNGEQLFYCLEDCLVFYTILSVCARTAEIEVLELCIMHNHTHSLIKAESMEQLSSFVDHYTAWFVREYNTFANRKGKLFKKNFGSAPKWDKKKLRSAIIYIGNNPVEKHFCKRAIEHRWNFLAYKDCCYPFSEKLSRRESSKGLLKALKEVDLMVKLNLPLKYAQLIRLNKKLSLKEREQLTDYIIYSYLPFDYEGLSSHFKSFESMLTAMDSTTGDDFDINEQRDGFSLTAFLEMMTYMERSMEKHEVRKATALPFEKKMQLYRELRFNTSATEYQICNFLHLNIPKD